MSHLIHWIHLPTCSFTLVVVHCNECTVHMDKLEYILCHITVECCGVCWKKNTHVLWGKGYNNGTKMLSESDHKWQVIPQKYGVKTCDCVFVCLMTNGPSPL